MREIKAHNVAGTAAKRKLISAESHAFEIGKWLLTTKPHDELLSGAWRIKRLLAAYLKAAGDDGIIIEDAAATGRPFMDTLKQLGLEEFKDWAQRD